MSISEAVSYIISASSVPATPATILLVDDDRAMLTILEEALKSHGYNILTARSGEDALALLAKQSAHIDTLILDREMPGLNGLGVVSKMKADPRFSAIPIIMLTGSGYPEQVQQGIDAGVFYYLIKPAQDSLLKSVVESALRENRQRKLLSGQISRRDSAMKAMRSCQLELKNLSEAEDAACFIACCFPAPERVATGLLELIINSIEHGNLGITYEEKAELIARNNWRQEVERRSALPEFSDKFAQIVFQHRPDGYYVQITDSGKGFDWKKYWQIDPGRATAAHGRGIARARTVAFDKLYYNAIGNQVTGVVSSKSDNLEW